MENTIPQADYEKDAKCLEEMEFYVSAKHECSYLPDTKAQMIFSPLDEKWTMIELSALSRMGFRRSGSIVYKPVCQQCKACVSCRVNVQVFQPNQTQKKLYRRNERDFLVTKIGLNEAGPIHYALFERYIQSRHGDGDMKDPSEKSFREFVTEHGKHSFLLCCYDQEQLIAVALCDQFDDGISAVYTFYDPNYGARSLGTYMILQQIDLAKSWQLPYVYLGYYIAQCSKMNYKAKFNAVEYLIGEQWQAKDNP